MKNILEYLEQTAITHSWCVAVDDGGVCLTWSELLDLSKSIGTAFCKKTENKKRASEEVNTKKTIQRYEDKTTRQYNNLDRFYVNLS